MAKLAGKSKAKAKRPGRPRSAVRSAPLTLWVPAGLRRTLERDAARHGRSLNREALARLAYPGRRADAAAHVHALGDLIARLTDSVETETGGAWHQDRFTFDEILAGIDAVLGDYMPQGEPIRPPALAAKDRRRENVARAFASRRAPADGVAGPLTAAESAGAPLELEPGDIGRSIARVMIAGLRSRSARALPPPVPLGTAGDDFYTVVNAALKLNVGDSK